MFTAELVTTLCLGTSSHLALRQIPWFSPLAAALCQATDRHLQTPVQPHSKNIVASLGQELNGAASLQEGPT